jgi:demethoxyubiquinone hydroxylase (CLK1/Coq7/Cat5 family)
MVIDPDKYDISIIRFELRDEDFKLRREPMSRQRRRDIIKALRVFHNLEMMAKTIYRFQITKEDSELNRQLIAAMCNEMTHYQDFTVKLYEYGSRPSLMRIPYWFVGFCFGFFSRLLGKTWTLRIGVWVESKAVHHYAQLLEEVEWDEDTRKMIEKDQNDEDGHITRWTKLLETDF